MSFQGGWSEWENLDLKPNSSWNRSIETFQGFTMDNFSEYFSDEMQKVKGFRFFKEGYVSNIYFNAKPWPDSDYCNAFQATCLPSMKQGKYKIVIGLIKKNSKIIYAYCQCPAGKGGKCHHIAATLYAIEDLSGKEEIPYDKTCTDRLCQWNNPSRKAGSKSHHKMLSDIKIVKLLPGKINKENCVFKNTYDPRPVNFRTLIDKSRLLLHEKLQIANPTSAFVTHFEGQVNPKKRPLSSIVVDGNTSNSIEILDENNRSPLKTRNHNETSSYIELSLFDQNFRGSVYEFVKLNYRILSQDEIRVIEVNTRDQSSNSEWLEQRRNKLTASNFGLFAKCSNAPDKRLYNYLYAQNNAKIDNLTAVKYGKQTEPLAILNYSNFKSSVGAPVKVDKSGLIVHSLYPFLAASPDGIVYEYSTGNIGLLEVKCPYSQRNKTIEECLLLKTFYLEKKDGHILLKKSHDYYFQVQGQLLISSRSWCDFFVFNGNDLTEQICIRIFKHEPFCQNLVESLCYFFLYAFVPEKVLERVKDKKNLYGHETYIPFKKAKAINVLEEVKAIYS